METPSTYGSSRADEAIGPISSRTPLDEDVRPSPHLPLLAETAAAIRGGLPSEQLANLSHSTEVLDDCKSSPLRTRAGRGSQEQHIHAASIEGKDMARAQQDAARKPLQLIDLPFEVLQHIVKEVTNTNDLIALSRCHSELHCLATPHIYRHFDIVWPDSHAHGENRLGVDALTYGLATLVMAEEIFGEAPHQRLDGRQIKRRRGNHYALFTKKFSVRNRPVDSVQDYLVSKEGGKMLGTLVALAVARMRSLEAFIWHMPTGIIRDVWHALSSLADRDDGHPCRLEKVWVRWHDNSSIARVESPTFSILPPLKSLSVVDIDELAYLDEMAVLVGKSVDRLRELRIGIARGACFRTWALVWQDRHLKQVDRNNPAVGAKTIGKKRLCGVLGIITGFVYDMCDSETVTSGTDVRQALRWSAQVPSRPAQSMGVTSDIQRTQDMSDVEVATRLQNAVDDDSPLERSGREQAEIITDIVPGNELADAPDSIPGNQPATENTRAVSGGSPPESPQRPAKTTNHSQLHDGSDIAERVPENLRRILQLETLELERVPLSIAVLQKAIDWTRLTSLTLLHCQHDEQLWKALRRTFAPRPRSPIYPNPRRKKLAPAKCDTEPEYFLKLTKIHTNVVSPALTRFLHETLAENTLEVLFLQDVKNSAVTIDSIFKGPLMRHRGSLKKLLIDSSENNFCSHTGRPIRWRKWILGRDLLSFICSGKMPQLRELGMAIDYRDWHFFLQRLPTIPHLRSLFLRFLTGNALGTTRDPRDLALQIVDLVALRPEVGLRYMWIATKCFEILETRKSTTPGGGYRSRSGSRLSNGEDELDDEDLDEEDDDDGDDAPDDVDVDNDDDDDDRSDIDDTESEEYDDNNDNAGEGEIDEENEASDGRAEFRLRAILWQDAKVALFKARHGTL